MVDDGAHAEAAALFPLDAASPLSPNPQTTATTMASPSPSISPSSFLALAEQTFTPMSMDASDFWPSNPANVDDAAAGTKPLAVPETDRLLRTARSLEQLRRDGNLSRSSSNSAAASAAGRGGASSVSAMVESFEALHATASTTHLGYELLRTKSQGQRPAGLVSPPSTLSPSPSISRSPSPSPAEQVPGSDPRSTADAGLGTVGQETPVAANGENEDSTVLQTNAATPTHPDPSAPVSHPSHTQNAPEAPRSAAIAPEHSPATVVADAALIRPTPSAHQPQTRSRAVSNPNQPAIVRTSSTASLSLSHPVPDADKLSQAGGFLGNIAALEATAERLSMTSSIEEAIREEHNELKRSESRRSSILRSRARAASAASDAGSLYGQSQLSVASRQNSILGINNAARSGGYSPGGYIMSPHHSMSAASGRLRSGSKASSIGMPSHIPELATPAGPVGESEHAQEFRFLPRHGPGKASTRSVASKLSLSQIAELEHPTALTQDVLDEADRAAATEEDGPDEEANIRASAHQFIEAEFSQDADALQPMLGHDSNDEPTPRLQLHQPGQAEYFGVPHGDDDRPTTSGSGATYEQAQAAFGDFDGVHCDPEADNFAPPPELEFHEAPPRHQATLAPRPTSYFDPLTGQQMLYYPAPVPAMLNLPPKLSKKPKPAAPIPRRSQIVSALPKAPRESRTWLPDPTEGLRTNQDDAPFMADYLGEGNASESFSQPAGMSSETVNEPSHARHTSEATIRITQPPPEQQREIRRPARLAEPENRQSRLPPQLRASAFFDLASEVPRIEVKDGSAMDTLDSLLDASAAAPVSAFTDHVFAGKLGAEVYGSEKRRKMKKSATAPVLAPEEKATKRKTLVKRNSSGNLLSAAPEDKPKRRTLVKRNSNANLLDPDAEKKRASHLTFFGSKHAADESDRDENVHRGDRSVGSASPDQLRPDADEEVTDEESEEEEEEEEEEPLYQGRPTTLLAELQLRKQQNKMRTRLPQRAHQDGMRSTLLELDAVAEVERKARYGKRVTLAWEDPAASSHQDSDEDEDVPLGMLYVAKAAAGGNRSTMDISALMSEVHRPLGLMERREMEENEPLSRRRDRLQGRAPEQQLPTSLTELHKRVSYMPGAGGGMGPRSQSRLTLPLHPGGSGSRAGSMAGSRPGSSAGGNDKQSDPEIEGETLAARKARLAAENPLPRARPVSGAFSSELLSQFGPDDIPPADKEDASAAAAEGKENHAPAADVPEEDETLGQRRRRLQREREAREREMAFSSLTRAATPLGLHPNSANNNQIRVVSAAPLQQQQQQQPRSPMAMADVLGYARSAAPVLLADPREQERLRREAELVRHRQNAEVKMAALRAQMPPSLTAPSIGARAGGYMGGRFNNGWGGNAGSGPGGNAVNASGLAVPYHLQQQQQQQRASTLLGNGPFMAGGAGQGMYGRSTPNLGVYGHGVPASMSVNALPMQMQMQQAGYGGAPMQMQMQMQMQMGGGQGHLDMVERWRQGVMP